MKAIVQDRYGSTDVLSLRDVPRPTCGPGQVLVEVKAASVHADIWHVVTGMPYVLRLMGAGLLRPKNPVPGIDLSGVVAEVGEGVTHLTVGDAVFGEVVNGFQWMNGGTFAEYAAVNGDALALKPDNVSFEEAAAAPTSAFIALRTLRGEGGLEAGQRVAINGAGGGVGVYAVQIAKAYDAHVTAIDCAEKLALLRTLGADEVVDYQQRDITAGADRFDLILDVASTLTLSDACRVLSPGGRYVLIGHDHYGEGSGSWLGSLPRMAGLALRTPFNPMLPPLSLSFDIDYLEIVRDLMARGKLRSPVDRTFPLAEVREAMAYLQSGSVKGKIVLTI